MQLFEFLKKLEEEYTDKPMKAGEKIDKSAVMNAATDAAEEIFGSKKVDLDTVGGMVDDAIKKGKDTEDAIQIAINMMRSGYKK